MIEFSGVEITPSEKKVLDEYREKLNKYRKEHPNGWWCYVKKDADLMECINAFTSFVDFDTNFATIVHIFLFFDKRALPICPVDGNVVRKTLQHLNSEYPTHCCRYCGSHDPMKYEHFKETCRRKYGCDNTFQAEQFKKKAGDTMERKYGHRYTQQCPELIDKCKATLIEHYGVDHQWKSEEIQKKSEDTLMRKYGTTNVFDLDSIRKKQHDTFRKLRYEKFLESKNIIPMFSLEEFTNCDNINTTVFKWKCVENGHNEIFESCIDENNFVRHGEFARCWTCHPSLNGSSEAELAIYEFVKSLTQNDVFNACPENRSIMNGREIDILVPKSKIGIEYDGLFFHSETFYNDNKNAQLEKTEFMENIGWRLIHIFEDEWEYNEEIVKSRLSSLFGVFKEKIYARSCTVKEIDTKTAKDFLNRTHLQGSCNSRVRLGLFLKDRLVSVMTFGKPRYSKQYEWELLRFSSELNCHVIGAAGKILKHFERVYSPISLISYADRRWSNGGLYRSLGFDELAPSVPSYVYTKGQNRYSRVAFQKHKLKGKLKTFDPKLTEKQNMLNNGYHIIYDCGNRVFVKEYQTAQI